MTELGWKADIELAWLSATAAMNDNAHCAALASGAYLPRDPMATLGEDAMRHATRTIVLLAILGGSHVLAQDAPGTLGDRLIQDAKDGSAVKVQQDLAAGADVNARHQNGRTALMLNAEWGENVDVINVLLAHGADINAKDNEGRTALMWAALEDKDDIVHLLVERGADVNAKANNGATALSLVEGDEIYVDEDLVNWLRAHGAQ